MKKILAVLSLALIIGLAGCYQATVPVYNPPITVIQTIPAVTVTPIAQTTVITVDEQTINQNVVSLPAADYALPTNPNQDGIGKSLVQVTLKVAALEKGNLVAVGSIPVWNSDNDDAIYSVTYGIFEQRDMVPAPSYFSGYVSTYSLVDIAGRTWSDIPVVFTVPKGTVNLPTTPVYFNIAVHNTNDSGTIQFQGAQRWEITFK